MEGIKFTFSTWISCWSSRVKCEKECFTWLGGLPGNNGRNAVVEALKAGLCGNSGRIAVVKAAARLWWNERYFYL
ncbi:hypothetical protein PRIO_5667 [Paenibacillus riograndensis SBR5]|uniref:Uncharacterized protein n=1 Tax=Paenibacillus riograndensis SBR5 TaxID=1073571 RepID=A0A0E4HHC2_9BACL|nr:hypothetical protein PRIO_5667 [Paenibacillus riograndensis SBR5]